MLERTSDHFVRTRCLEYTSGKLRKFREGLADRADRHTELLRQLPKPRLEGRQGPRQDEERAAEIAAVQRKKQLRPRDIQGGLEGEVFRRPLRKLMRPDFQGECVIGLTGERRPVKMPEVVRE